MTLTVESWCEALESGKYRQCKEALRVDDSFCCCLGVACDLSGAGIWENSNYVDHDGDWIAQVDIPGAVKNLFGLRTRFGGLQVDSLPDALRDELRPYLPYVSHTSSLAELNDEGCPFPLIAKVIRARPKGLFVETAP